MELMRRARAEVDDAAPRLILADWLERRSEPEAQEMCQVLRASFDGNNLVLLQPETAERLYPLTGARRGWFSGPWLGHGGELERLWLASPQTVELPGGVPLELEYIPSGTFWMGSPQKEKRRARDETRHKVTISSGFYLGKYPVTQAQWQAVMGKNPSHFKGELLPVETVSWDDAVSFCKTLCRKTKLDYRLPTEAEWEYACRAGTTDPFHFGTELNGIQANCDGKIPYGTTSRGACLQKTSPVGTYPPNRWGLFDMHGNVRDWVADWYGKYPNEPLTDPVGVPSGKFPVMRGGSWGDQGENCRAASRLWYNSQNIGDYLGGFRIALTSHS